MVGAVVISPKYGCVQLPVNKGRPSKVAVTRWPLRVGGRPRALPEMVETKTVDVESVVGVLEDVAGRKRLLARLEGAQPTKFGAVSLTLLHSC